MTKDWNDTSTSHALKYQDQWNLGAMRRAMIPAWWGPDDHTKVEKPNLKRRRHPGPREKAEEALHALQRPMAEGEYLE